MSKQEQANARNHRVRLYPVQLPEQVIDGVIFQPTTQLLRIEGIASPLPANQTKK